MEWRKDITPIVHDITTHWESCLHHCQKELVELVCLLLEHIHPDILIPHTHVKKQINRLLRKNEITESSPHPTPEPHVTIFEDSTQDIPSWENISLFIKPLKWKIDTTRFTSDNQLIDIYGGTILQLSPVAQRTIEDLKKPPLSSSDILSHLEVLRNLPQPPQKSEEWMQLRHNLLTASIFGKAFFFGKGTKRSLLIEKVKPYVPHGSGKTHSLMHGIIFEDIAKKIFEKKYHVVVEEYGCIVHPHITWLGASPDGICIGNHPMKGYMLEIKCPSSRKIDPHDINKLYWAQTQLQMEVCNLEKCVFLQCQFESFSTLEQLQQIILTDPSPYTDMGFIGTYYQNYQQKRKYYDIRHQWAEVSHDQVSFEKWCHHSISDNWSEPCFQHIFWRLRFYSEQLIYRDRDWFAQALRSVDLFWKEVLYFRREEAQEQFVTIEAEKKPKKSKKFLDFSNCSFVSSPSSN